MSKRTIPTHLHASADLLARINAKIAGDPERGGLVANGSVTLEAAAPDAKVPRKFSMDAYNGGLMRFWWADDPVVVDLAGLEITAKARPILKDHQPALVVGHSERVWVDAGRTLKLTGIASGTGPAAREVIANSDNGFPWQASIGAEIKSVEEVRAGASVSVNGQTFNGPLLVVRASRLGEVSFVALGADDSTAARMIASRTNHTHKENSVGFEAWLKAQGFDLATLTDNQKQALQAAYDAKHPAKVEAKVDDGADQAANDIKARRELAAAETERIAAIGTVCANKHPKIEAQAIREGWSKEKVELEVLRAERPSGPAIGGSNRTAGLTKEVLEAAVLQAGRAPETTLRAYGDQVLQAAHTAFRGRISLGELLIEAARANGYTGRAIKVNTDVLRAAFALQAGSFSQVDIGGIISNVANKTILDAFMAVDQAWRQIAAIGSVSDFKTVTRYRMTGDNQYEEVGQGGEIKHGKLGEESFTNRAKTYAKLLGITREHIINDDLGALTVVPRMLGRGAALKLNDVVWTAFLDNASFFAAGNNNYFEGASTVLSIDSLSTALQKFRDQVDADGKPLALAPTTLLVPTALEGKAAALMASTEVRDTTANTKIPTANPHAGNYKAVVSPYLSNSNYTGYSSTAWYLLANPADLAVLEVVFLDGQESPTIESAVADFDSLGVQMRGFHDFGATKQDSRAGVKSKGAA